MAQVNLTKEQLVDNNLDGVVIQVMLEDIPGGRSLDVDGVDGDYLKAGHVIIQETATKEYKALGKTEATYIALPGGHTYAGILYVSVPMDAPLASIMVRGTVNEKAATDTDQGAGLPPYAAAMKTALNLIRFVEA